MEIPWEVYLNTKRATEYLQDKVYTRFTEFKMNWNQDQRNKDVMYDLNWEYCISGMYKEKYYGNITAILTIGHAS